jgi:hypothetical protein
MEDRNNKHSLVSIIMPTYNEAEYIKAATDLVGSSLFYLSKNLTLTNNDIND